MDTFLREIEAYAAAAGTSPQALLRDILNAEWGRWQGWQDRTSSPRYDTMERVRAHMAANPPQLVASRPEDAARTRSPRSHQKRSLF